MKEPRKKQICNTKQPYWDTIHYIQVSGGALVLTRASANETAMASIICSSKLSGGRWSTVISLAIGSGDATMDPSAAFPAMEWTSDSWSVSQLPSSLHNKLSLSSGTSVHLSGGWFVTRALSTLLADSEGSALRC